MSVEQARGLIQKIATDPEFKERLESTPVEDKRSVLVEAGFGDLKLRHLSQALPESVGGEIPDDELEAVAGGGGTGTAVSTTVTVVAGGYAGSEIEVAAAAAAAF